MTRNQSAPHFMITHRNYSTTFTPLPRLYNMYMYNIHFTILPRLYNIYSTTFIPLPKVPTNFCVTTITKAADLCKQTWVSIRWIFIYRQRCTRCLFIICVIVYNLYYCCYAKTSSSAVHKRHRKVYGNPIAPSFYSILLVLFYL